MITIVFAQSGYYWERERRWLHGPVQFDALRRSFGLNPGNKRQLPRKPTFETLFADPDFKKISGL